MIEEESNKTNRRPWARRFARLSLRALTLLGLMMALVTLTPIDDWWARKLEGTVYFDQGDVLIVLSGSMMDEGVMGWSSYLRSMHAARTFHPGGFKHIVLSGGAISGKPAAVAMADYIRCQGVPTEAISLETASLSTHENALFSKSLLDKVPGRKVLLTSDYHMFRAFRVFSKIGMQVDPLPIPDVRKRATSYMGRWPAFVDLVLETGKIAYYWLRGWI